jgi:hypothetical protein
VILLINFFAFTSSCISAGSTGFAITTVSHRPVQYASPADSNLHHSQGAYGVLQSL